MEFCDNCQNKMNIKWNNKKTIINEDGTEREINTKILIYYCVTCGNTKYYDKDTIINPKLYHQNYQRDKSFITFNNELLCQDPTLQKVPLESEIKCPTCSEEKNKDITYYIYDIDNMKYLYICCHCKSSWKTE